MPDQKQNGRKKSSVNTGKLVAEAGKQSSIFSLDLALGAFLVFTRFLSHLAIPFVFLGHLLFKFIDDVVHLIRLNMSNKPTKVKVQGSAITLTILTFIAGAITACFDRVKPVISTALPYFGVGKYLAKFGGAVGFTIAMAIATVTNGLALIGKLVNYVKYPWTQTPLQQRKIQNKAVKTAVFATVAATVWPMFKFGFSPVLVKAIGTKILTAVVVAKVVVGIVSNPIGWGFGAAIILAATGLAVHRIYKSYQERKIMRETVENEFANKSNVEKRLEIELDKIKTKAQADFKIEFETKHASLRGKDDTEEYNNAFEKYKKGNIFRRIGAAAVFGGRTLEQKRLDKAYEDAVTAKVADKVIDMCVEKFVRFRWNISAEQTLRNNQAVQQINAGGFFNRPEDATNREAILQLMGTHLTPLNETRWGQSRWLKKPLSQKEMTDKVVEELKTQGTSVVLETLLALPADTLADKDALNRAIQQRKNDIKNKTYHGPFQDQEFLNQVKAVQRAGEVLGNSYGRGYYWETQTKLDTTKWNTVRKIIEEQPSNEIGVKKEELENRKSSGYLYRGTDNKIHSRGSHHYSIATVSFFRVGFDSHMLTQIKDAHRAYKALPDNASLNDRRQKLENLTTLIDFWLKNAEKDCPNEYKFYNTKINDLKTKYVDEEITILGKLSGDKDVKQPKNPTNFDTSEENLNAVGRLFLAHR